MDDMDSRDVEAAIFYYKSGPQTTQYEFETTRNDHTYQLFL